MKATEQYFPVVLFIMLYEVFLALSLWMTTDQQMRAIDHEQHFLVVLSTFYTLVILYEKVLTFEPVGRSEILTVDDSDKS